MRTVERDEQFILQKLPLLVLGLLGQFSGDILLEIVEQTRDQRGEAFFRAARFNSVTIERFRRA